MFLYSEIKKNTYFDSVSLMLLSQELNKIPGIVQAAVMMGTPHNQVLMKRAGVLDAQSDAGITANDLLIGLQSDNQKAVDEALSVVQRLFEKKKECISETARPVSIADAKKHSPDLNLAVISVSGQFAAYEAKKALAQNMHVLLFSDNVSVQDEIHLKQTARENGLLLMGPDCGTAIINGAGIGFANAVRRGDIGLVAASGTGLQELTVLIDRLGYGISQAIGAGGRDLSAAVGGITTLMALEALLADNDTKKIGIISKPPAPEVMEQIIRFVEKSSKPVVTCFLSEDAVLQDLGGVIHTRTLEECAQILTGQRFNESENLQRLAQYHATKLAPEQKYLRGLYTGGTLCYEALIILKQSLGKIYSNLAKKPDEKLPDAEQSLENTLLDLGDDFFTDGRPHPMIDTTSRSQRVQQELQDREVAVVLLDCVLGYGSHPNPAQPLVEEIERYRQKEPDRHICFIASVCGTEKDAQGLMLQRELLANAGVVVLESNAAAVRFAAMIMSRIGEGR